MTPSTLPLLDLPFVFSQVPLMSSGQFREEASKRWDQGVSIDDLEQLHQLGLLIPLYRADDDRETGILRIPHQDDRSKIARYAREGLIRDPQAEDPVSPAADSVLTPRSRRRRVINLDQSSIGVV